MHVLPRSLVARTSTFLIIGLAVVELAGLVIHGLDRFHLQERNAIHEEQVQVFSIYRTVAEAPPEDRMDAIEDLRIPPNVTVELLQKPDPDVRGVELPRIPRMGMMRRVPGRRDVGEGSVPHAPSSDHPDARRAYGPDSEIMPGSDPTSRTLHAPPDIGDFFLGRDREGRRIYGDRAPGRPGEEPRFHPGISAPGSPRFPSMDGRPHDMPPFMRWAFLPSSLYPLRVVVGQTLRTHSSSLLLPDGRNWVVIRFVTPFPDPFGSPTYLVVFIVMSVAGTALIVWATRRLIAPVTTLANAAEALGRDVHTAALPETGPSEIRRAAVAFNTMAARIRRFVTDRTLMLTAIGHDLRTPITRLKLRAELIDDEALRTKVLADLDEMEAMVAATLAFGRDSSSAEPIVSLDLGTMLETIMDEAAESFPDHADALVYERPAAPVRIKARTVALKRALNNLILNALKYAGNATVTLLPPDPQARTGDPAKLVRVIIDDDGPGLPEADLDRVFEPFVRIESSRNRETGGTGLGLSIARTILHGQGGDVRLENRATGGLRVVISLAP